MAVNQQRGLLKLTTEVPGARPYGEDLSARMPGTGAERAARTTAAASGEMARDLASLGETIGKYADHAAQLEGAREGKLAGMDPEFRPREDNTIRGEAYDRVGLETYRSTVAVEIENDIAAGGDLGKKRDAWLTRVPDALVPDVANAFRRGELAQSREKARLEVARINDEARASLQGDIDTKIRTLHQRAFTLGLDETADKTLAGQVAEIERVLRRTDPTGRPLVSPEYVAKILKHAKETAIDARLLGALDRQPTPEARQAFVDKFEDDWKTSQGLAKFYDLAGFEKISSRFRSILTSDRAEQRQRLSAMNEDLNKLKGLTEKGFAPTDAQFDGLTARVQALNDPGLSERLEVIKDIANFQALARKAPPEEIDRYAAMLREDIKTNGMNPLKAERVLFAEKLAAESRRELKADPLGWADRVGYVKVTPIDFSSPEKAAATLTARIVQAEDIAAHFRNEAPSYLRPAERRQLAAIAAQGGANMLGIASTIAEAGGKRAPAIMAELFPDAPIVATLGGHVAALGNTNVAQDVADGIALSRMDVKAGQSFKSIAPSADKTREWAVSVHGGSLNGLARSEQALIAAANSAYEVRARRQGLTSPNEELWKQTFKELIGERSIGGEVYGGITYGRPGALWGGDGAVIVPPNVKRDRFRDLVMSIDLADFGDRPPTYGDGRAVSPVDFRRAQLVQQGEGRYWLNIGTADAPRWLVDQDRQPFVLDMKSLEVVLKSRRGDLYLDGKRPLPGMMRLGGPLGDTVEGPTPRNFEPGDHRMEIRPGDDRARNLDLRPFQPWDKAWVPSGNVHTLQEQAKRGGFLGYNDASGEDLGGGAGAFPELQRRAKAAGFDMDAEHARGMAPDRVIEKAMEEIWRQSPTDDNAELIEALAEKHGLTPPWKKDKR